MKNRIVIGSRKSRLALFQSNFVKDEIEKRFPHFHVSIHKMTTVGDRILDRPLSKIGDKGLFTKELEDALLSEKIDLAVHSLKDLPTELPGGLSVSAYCKREECRDCLVSRGGVSLQDLAAGARIGTSSLRRKSQLMNLRPDFNVVDIRGNVETRLKKLSAENMDAIVMAAAGLLRLGLAKEITEIISPDVITPAAGQGIIAIESKSGRGDLESILLSLNDADSATLAMAERGLLGAFGGGCRAPVGAFATIEGDQISLSAYVGSLDGGDVMRGAKVGPKTQSAEIGESLAREMLKDGAAGIIERARNESA